MAHIPGDILTLMHRQGWNEDTLLDMLFDFLNIADEAEAFAGYCATVARDENAS